MRKRASSRTGRGDTVAEHLFFGQRARFYAARLSGRAVSLPQTGIADPDGDPVRQSVHLWQDRGADPCGDGEERFRTGGRRRGRAQSRFAHHSLSQGGRRRRQSDGLRRRRRQKGRTSQNGGSRSFKIIYPQKGQRPLNRARFTNAESTLSAINQLVRNSKNIFYSGTSFFCLLNKGLSCEDKKAPIAISPRAIK